MTQSTLSRRQFRRFDKAIGEGVPRSIAQSLVLLSRIPYWSFDGRTLPGQLIVAQTLRDEVRAIFAELYSLKFPIGQMTPVVRFNGSDEASMAANNTSCFNLRMIAGTDIPSLHGKGRAIDVNPMQNPCIYADGRSVPPGAEYRPGHAGTFFEGSEALKVFLKRGWRWGGHYENLKDYHHFEKPE